MQSETLMNVVDARVEFHSSDTVVKALDGVSIHVGKGETVAVVGESGCGKTTLARSILGLQKLTAGDIVFSLPDSANKILAEKVGMVWQDPFASLDPRWKIRQIIEEPLKLAKKTGNVDEILEMVGLTVEMGNRYPHQLSGGQRQRAAIGRALALHPPLLICDEPTAALDLSIQAQILNLLRDLQKKNGCSIIYISHDLATVRFVADRIYVMYFGKVVEEGPIADVFDNPQHPYTRQLLGSALTLDNLGHLPEAVEEIAHSK